MPFRKIMPSFILIGQVIFDEMFEKVNERRTQSDDNSSHGLKARWAKRKNVYSISNKKQYARSGQNWSLTSKGSLTYSTNEGKETNAILLYHRKLYKTYVWQDTTMKLSKF